MSLANLLKMGRLKAHTTDRIEIGKLLTAAARNLRDAAIESASGSARYTCAYTAIMQASQAAMFANGYRPNTSEGGHHMTLVQGLVHTINLGAGRMQVLDTLRRKRNVIDYSGDEPDPSEVREAIAAATRLLDDVTTWLKKVHPELA